MNDRQSLSWGLNPGALRRSDTLSETPPPLLFRALQEDKQSVAAFTALKIGSAEGYEKSLLGLHRGACATFH